MRLVKRRSDKQSLISGQFGLLAGVAAAYFILRDTHHIAHFWIIAIVLSLVFECTLLFRFERN